MYLWAYIIKPNYMRLCSKTKKYIYILYSQRVEIPEKIKTFYDIMVYSKFSFYPTKHRNGYRQNTIHKSNHTIIAYPVCVASQQKNLTKLFFCQKIGFLRVRNRVE